MSDRLNFEYSALAEAIALIDWHLVSDRRRIVIRPHPQENGGHWLHRYGGRVTVAPGTDRIPWLRHAALALHSGSTTGIEAAIMGTPVIDVCLPSPWGERVIVSEFNPTVATALEAISVLSSGVLPKPRRRVEEPFFHAAVRAVRRSLLRGPCRQLGQSIDSRGIRAIGPTCTRRDSQSVSRKCGA